METSTSLDGAVELSEGLSLVPCTLISLSFVRADVSVRPVDEWKLKEGLTALFKKTFGLTVADRDLVVQKEKNYFKKRRDEPIAHGVLHLWGSKPEGDPLRVGGEGADWRKYVAESVNGIELNVSGLKLRCIALIKETNNFDALKQSWEAVFGPRRGEGAQAGPTTLTLKGVPSRWFAEPRVSSKPSVLVTHTIFSSFGEIRNLEVLGNEELAKNPRDVGSMAAALQCQVWVQFINHASFCKTLQTFCGRAMQKAGSSFRATYEVDWDKENFFSVMNVRRRKFEKERLEQQLRIEAELLRKREAEARQAEFARVEEERLKMERMAAALRAEERQRQLDELAKELEEESRMQMLDPDTSSEEKVSIEGILFLQNDRDKASGEGMLQSGTEMKQRISEEDERFSPSRKTNVRHTYDTKDERLLLPVRDEGRSSSDDDESLHSPVAREKRRHMSETDEEIEALSPLTRDKRGYTSNARRETVLTKKRAKRGEASEDEDIRPVRNKSRDSLKDEAKWHSSHARKQSEDTSEDDFEANSPVARNRRKDTSEEEGELRPLPPRMKFREYTSEEEESRALHRKDRRRYTSDDEEGRFIPESVDKRSDTSKEGGRITNVFEENASHDLYNPLERWEPVDETPRHLKLAMGNSRHEEQSYEPRVEGSMTASKRFSSPEASDEEEELEHDEYIKEDAWRGKDDHYEVDRWALDVTHSVASLSVSEMLLQAPRHTHKGGMDNFEKRLRSIITISS
ncbi:uncharacterized protein [Physcomitrium patens]|uniref:uncharacterized protein isoform X3 n=1 Tax=Physcomitrium patens TaxID=3218 RepID=UPI000D178494|nr:A-kinase anchor protein 17A-like isoform X3 [Physcomitrium patens]|eukprot:XP_024391205.1 A-kinase anchor protein 17A-like isoform X3 [Physcomitrella patens]